MWFVSWWESHRRYPSALTVSVIEANIDDASPQVIALRLGMVARSGRARCPAVIRPDEEGPPGRVAPGHRSSGKAR